jgi:hypothetical protein
MLNKKIITPHDTCLESDVLDVNLEISEEVSYNLCDSGPSNVLDTGLKNQIQKLI